MQEQAGFDYTILHKPNAASHLSPYEVQVKLRAEQGGASRKAGREQRERRVAEGERARARERARESLIVPLLPNRSRWASRTSARAGSAVFLGMCMHT